MGDAFERPFMENICVLIIDYLCTLFMSLLIVINSKNYKSKYLNTIRRIMTCIMSELWKNTIKPLNDT